MTDDLAAIEADLLEPALLATRLRTTWLGRRHLHVPLCASTNDLATAEARAGAPEGFLVTADEQTRGRGRLGRTWHSPPGTNLYLSLLLRPQRPATEIPPLTLLVGGALAQAIGGLGFEARVKWPNDVLLRGRGRRHGPEDPPLTDQRWRKVAGILTEASTDGDRVGHVIVGVGLNANVATFPEDLADKATSLRLARGAPVSRVDVLARVLAEVESAYDRFRVRGAAAAIELWEAHAALGGRCRAQIGDRRIEGMTTGVAADGALLVRDDEGTDHRIVSGEVVAVQEHASDHDHV